MRLSATCRRSSEPSDAARRTLFLDRAPRWACERSVMSALGALPDDELACVLEKCDLLPLRVVRATSRRWASVARAVVRSSTWRANAANHAALQTCEWAGDGVTRTMLVGYNALASAVALATDGTFVACITRDRMLRVWDLATGVAAPPIRLPAQALCVALQRARLAVGLENGSIHSYAVGGSGGRAVTVRSAVELRGHLKGVCAVAWGVGALLSAGVDRKLRVWDDGAVDGTCTVLQRHARPVTALVVAGGLDDMGVCGERFLSGGEDRLILIWWRPLGLHAAAASASTSTPATAAASSGAREHADSQAHAHAHARVLSSIVMDSPVRGLAVDLAAGYSRGESAAAVPALVLACVRPRARALSTCPSDCQAPAHAPMEEGPRGCEPRARMRPPASARPVQVPIRLPSARTRTHGRGAAVAVKEGPAWL